MQADLHVFLWDEASRTRRRSWDLRPSVALLTLVARIREFPPRKSGALTLVAGLQACVRMIWQKFLDDALSHERLILRENRGQAHWYGAAKGRMIGWPPAIVTDGGCAVRHRMRCLGASPSVAPNQDALHVVVPVLVANVAPTNWPRIKNPRGQRGEPRGTVGRWAMAIPLTWGNIANQPARLMPAGNAGRVTLTLRSSLSSRREIIA